MSRLQTVQIHAKLLDSSHALALQNTLALTNISVLDLKTCGIDDEFIVILCSALLHSRVQVLDLYSNRIGNDGVQQLAQVLSSTNIKQLVLSYNRFNIHGLQQLSSGLVNSKVTSLKIPSVRIDPEPIREFFDNIHLMNLEALELYRNIGVENTQMLLNNMTRSNLKKLEIEILTEYLPAFLKTIYHSKVTDLHLISNDPDECCRVIAENKEYLKLDKLRIGKGVTAKGLKDLFSTIKLVKELDLQENFKLGDKEMEIISKYLPKTNLQKLVLSGCSFKDDGLVSLMNGLQKSSLQYLELRYMKASTEAVVSFMKGVCDSLKVLDISYGNMLDFARIRAESMRYPRLKVINLSNW
ncbi:hypothetical protein HDV04_001220 [Boothiomyces sp. JEL0838]|nr:hypothetical protein HDV04_001220 [Boothiomyces sp. JEL0838]